MSGIQGIQKILEELTKYARNRVASDPGSSQLMPQTATKTGIRDQVLLAFIDEKIFTENQAEAFKLSKGGNINKQLPLLSKIINARETENPMNTITQNSSGNPQRIQPKINFKNNKGSSRSVPLDLLLSNYTGVMSHNGHLKLLVSKDQGPRGTEILDLDKYEITYTKEIDLWSPVTTIMEKLEYIGDSVMTYFKKRRFEKFIGEIKDAANRYREYKERIQTGRTTSSEIALLPSILAAKNVNDLRDNIIGKNLFNKVFTSKFSRQLLNEFYKPAHRSILRMGQYRDGINKLKEHLSKLQIDELKRRLSGDEPISLERKQTMAITELIIALLEASSRSSSSTQTYGGSIAPQVNRNPNVPVQAQSESINIHRQAQLRNVVARQAAERAFERAFESRNNGRPGFASAAAGPSGIFQPSEGYNATVQQQEVNMNNGNNAQSALQNAPERARSAPN